MSGVLGGVTRRVGRWAAAAVAVAAVSGSAWAQPVPTVPFATPTQIGLSLQTLRNASGEGLSPDAYLAVDPDDPAAVLRGLARYARDAKVGRLAASDFPAFWGLRPAPYDPGLGLAAALAEDRLDAWIAEQHPLYAGYHALRRGLARYRGIAASGGWAAIPAGPSMTLGSTDPRVAALRARLAIEDSQVDATVTGAFDADLQAAVTRAQRHYGLKPDGAVGPAMLRALNVPVGQRIRQIVANMERWRWLPPEMPASRVQVNAAAAIITLFRDDQPFLSMKAVSGKPGNETPMLVSAIHSVVINPPWNVPGTIARKELFPKERAHPGYFAANDFVLIPNPDGSQRLQQRAGPKAALGRFKFDFQNPFSVYLHDTPSRAAFEQVARNASHGCVRLENARLLATALLEGDPKWTPEAIQAQLDSGRTLRAPLAEKVPVYILYWTAFAGSDGAMNFRPDPYGWDGDLLRRLSAVGAPE